MNLVVGDACVARLRETRAPSTPVNNKAAEAQRDKATIAASNTCKCGECLI